MKRSIRYGVFETNSSSVHSLTIVSKEEFEKFKRGELIFERWNNKLVEATKERIEDEDGEYETYSALGGGEYETFEETHTTKNGDVVVAFGFYGND